MHSTTPIAIVVTTALFAVAFAGHIPHGHASSYASVQQHFDVHHHGNHGYGSHTHHQHVHHHEPHHHPKYEFKYGVKDAHTGDYKSQWEHRDGDHVKGGYTFAEADGTIRVVEYTADKHKGFQAVVKRIGHAHHPQAYSHVVHGHI